MPKPCAKVSSLRARRRTRSRFGCFGVAVLIAAGVLGFFLVAGLGQYSSAVICVPLGLGIAAVAMIIAARYMPRKTEKGADASARWLAFKRYLQNLEKYTKVEEATDIFDSFLPYAVAFGLEQSWLKKFSAVNAPAPTWWIPYGPGPMWYGPGPVGRGGMSGGGRSRR